MLSIWGLWAFQDDGTHLRLFIQSPGNPGPITGWLEDMNNHVLPMQGVYDGLTKRVAFGAARAPGDRLVVRSYAGALIIRPGDLLWGLAGTWSGFGFTFDRAREIKDLIHDDGGWYALDRQMP